MRFVDDQHRPFPTLVDLREPEFDFVVYIGKVGTVDEMEAQVLRKLVEDLLKAGVEVSNRYDDEIRIQGLQKGLNKDRFAGSRIPGEKQPFLS